MLVLNARMSIGSTNIFSSLLLSTLLQITACIKSQDLKFESLDPVWLIDTLAKYSEAVYIFNAVISYIYFLPRIQAHCGCISGALSYGFRFLNISYGFYIRPFVCDTARFFFPIRVFWGYIFMFSLWILRRSLPHILLWWDACKLCIINPLEIGDI